jgi:hypothetical protein
MDERECRAADPTGGAFPGAARRRRSAPAPAFARPWPLADNHPLIRVGLANLLRTEPEFRVVAKADDGEATILLLQERVRRLSHRHDDARTKWRVKAQLARSDRRLAAHATRGRRDRKARGQRPHAGRGPRLRPRPALGTRAGSHRAVRRDDPVAHATRIPLACASGLHGNPHAFRPAPSKPAAQAREYGPRHPQRRRNTGSRRSTYCRDAGSRRG